jgi:hypothetical protein
MKRTALFIAVILNLQFSISNLQAQTGLYKHFANRPGVKAYCVERYPLAEGDTACVTLLQVDDSATYKALRKEILDLKKQLYHEKMRADFYDTMVNVAEEMFGIEIRKKAVTGQSKCEECPVVIR